MRVLKKPNKPANCFAAILVALLAIQPPLSASAAFLKLGPFEFEAETRAEAVYTTNVEGERPSQETADPEDFYLVWALDLNSSTDFLPATQFNFDTGIAIEKHFNRPDLDNSQAPFGRAQLDFQTEREPLIISGLTRWERTSESVDDKFVPTELRAGNKSRQVGTDLEYGGAVRWESERLRLGADYSLTQERFDDYEYYEEEQDEETLTYDVGLSLTDFLGLAYKKEYTKKILVNLPDGEGPLEETETYTIDLNQNIWDRPEITYSLGVQREYIDEETDGWEFVHNLTISDEMELSPALKFSGSVNYKHEDNPEEDDIGTTFEGSLEHQLSRRVNQVFTAKREPVDTLGSTQDTDETTYAYSLGIDDFLLPDVAAKFGLEHKISRPVDGEVERLRNYTAGISHTVQINSRLSRNISYDYTRETSNLEFDVLEEHRVTFGLVLDL